jgi:DNA-binding NarL/FixJ family response regulator
MKHKPQVVVIDLSMAGIGGYETIRRIRAQAPEAKIISLHFQVENSRSFAC